MATFIIMVIAVVISLQYKPVQSYFGRVAARFLSKELNTTITVQSLYLKPFSSFTLEGLYMEDLSGDTLLYAGNLEANLDLAKFFQNRVVIHNVQLTSSQFYLKKQEDGQSNAQFAISYFHPGQADDRKQRIILALDELHLQDIDFRYLDLTNTTKSDHGIDFADVHVTGINGAFTEIDFDQHWFSSTIDQLSLYEKSGFHLHHLEGKLRIDSNFIDMQDMEIAINQSILRDQLRLSFDSYADFGDFTQKVHVNLQSNRSRIVSEDIAYFAPEITATTFDAILSGDLQGRVNEIVGQNITLLLADQTQLRGEVRITGLPDIETTQFDLDLTNLTTNYGEIQYLTRLFADRAQFSLPQELQAFGTVQYTGTLTGKYHDFIANGMLTSPLGQLETDLNFLIREEIGYAGRIRTEQLDLGLWTKIPSLRHIGFDLEVEGKSFDFDALAGLVSSHIHYVDFNGYRYENLNISAQVDHQVVEGSVDLHDPHLQLTAQALVDFSQPNRRYQWNGEILHAALEHLKWYDQRPLTIGHVLFNSDIEGNTLNELTGHLALQDVRYQVEEDHFHVPSLSLHVSGRPSDKEIAIRSDILDAHIAGAIDLPEIPAYFRHIVGHYLPSLQWKKEPDIVQDFAIDIKIKDFSPAAVFIDRTLHLEEGAALQAHFSSEQQAFLLNLHIPEGAWANLSAQNIYLRDQGNADQMIIHLQADSITVNDYQYFDQLVLEQHINNDHLTYVAAVNGSLENFDNQIELTGSVDFRENLPANLRFATSDITINGSNWQINPQSRLDVHKDGVFIPNFELSNQKQRIRARGVVSKAKDEQLQLDFEDFGLAAINPFIISSGFALAGVINGYTEITSILDNPYAIADLTVQNIALNDKTLGDLALNADFDQNQQQINVRMHIDQTEKRMLAMDGAYKIGETDNPLLMRVLFQDLELNVAQPVLTNLVSDIKGMITGSASITGSIRQPRITGTGSIADGGFRVKYLNTTYKMSGPINMESTSFVIKDMLLEDISGQKATANGRIDLNQVRNPFINARIDATNFMILNTTMRNNPLYYGTAYGTGYFSFSGRTDNMFIDINARTDEQTSMHIPLNYSSTLGDSDFIRFVSPDDEADQAVRSESVLTEGLHMNMALQVTPGAEISIYTDLGELSGRGEGQLDLRISSLGDFEMFGDYRINAGKFTFNAQDFINKIFEIRQGGSIRWTGKPTESLVNLTAFYEQRTSLSALYNAAGRPSNEQRVVAQAEMDLSGSLLRPAISFGLNFPLDPYVKDELQSYLTDANNVNQQALSLIVRRSFTPGSTTDFSRELNSTLLSAGTELAFNQLNNIIAQSLNLNFVDLNIRSLNDASASFRFFDDRLLFTGGITDRRDQQLNDLNVFSNRVATDAELLYLLRRDGRLVLRGSNRLNTRHFLLTPTDDYISALGLIYRQEFNTVGEFFQRILWRRKHSQKMNE